MSSKDFETTIDDLHLTKREAKELRQLVVPLSKAVNMQPTHLGPIQWIKSLLVVALVLALALPLGYGFYLGLKSEWLSHNDRIWELLILIMAIVNLYESKVRGRLIRKLYHVLQVQKEARDTKALS